MNKFFRRNWPLILAMYVGGGLGAFADLTLFQWEWWVLMIPMAGTIGVCNAYRQRYLMALDKW